MSIKELKKEIESHTGVEVVFELGKKYEAFNKDTYELVAVYDPKKGTLEYK